MQNEISLLEKEGRKNIYWRDFKSITEMDIDLIKSYIFGAIMIDDQLNQKKWHTTNNYPIELGK